MTLDEIKIRARRHRWERERLLRWVAGLTLVIGATLSIVMPHIELPKTIEWSLFFAALGFITGIIIWTWRTARASRQKYEDEIDIAIVNEAFLEERANPGSVISGEELERRLKEMN